MVTLEKLFFFPREVQPPDSLAGCQVTGPIFFTIWAPFQLWLRISAIFFRLAPTAGGTGALQVIYWFFWFFKIYLFRLFFFSFWGVGQHKPPPSFLDQFSGFLPNLSPEKFVNTAFAGTDSTEITAFFVSQSAMSQICFPSYRMNATIPHDCTAPVRHPVGQEGLPVLRRPGSLPRALRPARTSPPQGRRTSQRRVLPGHRLAD